MKKNLQNIERNLENLCKIQSLLEDLLIQNNHSDESKEILKDLANAVEHSREAYFEFNLIAQASLDVILRLSASGEILYVSPSCKELAGYEPCEVTGKPFTELLPESGIYEYTNVILNFFRERYKVR